jgi:DNA primase
MTHILPEMARDHVVLKPEGREIKFSNPDKVFFPERGHTKLDLCEY